MNQLQLVFLDLLSIIENILFLTLVLKINLKFKKNNKLIYFLPLLLFYCIFLAFFPKKIFLLCIIELFYIANIYFFAEESLTETLKIWSILFLFLSLLESLLQPIIIIFIPNANKFTQILCCTVLAVFMIFMYHRLISSKISDFKWNSKLWGVFVSALLLVELMITYFLTILNKLEINRWIKLGSILVLFGGLAVCVIIFSVVYYYNQKEDYRIQMEMIEKLNAQQKEHFTNLLDQEESTRQFRHDMINHLLSLKTMSDSKHYSALGSYIDELTDALGSLNCKQYDIGNDILNTILNYYLIPMKDECEIIIDGFVGDMECISQKDMCTLAANVIKNAAEAVKMSSKKMISFQIEEGKHFLRMKVDNTYSGKLLIDEEGSYKSTKEDQKNHGFGLKNIKDVVKKYNGKEQIVTDNGIFSIEVFLHI